MNIIADYFDLCGECPICDRETATLYWTGCVGWRLYRYRPNSHTRELVQHGCEINDGIWLRDGADEHFDSPEADGAKRQMKEGFLRRAMAGGSSKPTSL